MFELLRQDTKRKHLGFGHGFIGRCAIGERTWHLSNLGQPAPVAFALTLEIEFHARLLGEAESIAVVPDASRMAATSTRRRRRQSHSASRIHAKKSQWKRNGKMRHLGQGCRD